LSDEEHRRFKTLAEDMGLPVSNMIRTLVRAQELEKRPRRRRRPQRSKSTKN
jgi:hypothetical protein